VATDSTPMTIEVALSQLVTRLPAALPTGTRPEAIPPTAIPSASGASTDEAAEALSTTRI
jgi:hypothetical protein